MISYTMNYFNSNNNRVCKRSYFESITRCGNTSVGSRTTKSYNYFVLLIFLLLVVNVYEDICGEMGIEAGKKIRRQRSGIVFASASTYYRPNWQQYYPYRKWPHYDEQIHGRPNRFRVGQGRYRILPSGAQLMCDFPDTMMLMISNIIWERADLGHGNSLDEIYRDHGIQQDYILLSRPRGSTLHLFEVTPLDRGLYRCIASALDPNDGSTVTLFQDVHFYPIF